MLWNLTSPGLEDDSPPSRLGGRDGPRQRGLPLSGAFRLQGQGRQGRAGQGRAGQGRAVSCIGTVGQNFDLGFRIWSVAFRSSTYGFESFGVKA